MKTDDLIQALRADNAAKAMPFGIVGKLGLVAAVLVAGVAFFAMLGPRPDISLAMTTMRFPFKFVVTTALVVGAIPLFLHLAQPGRSLNPLLLLAAPILVAVASIVEIIALPAGDIETAWIGKNAMLCMTFIPLIGIGPLAIFLAVLRYAAPTRPALAGSVAGVLAGGVAATFYASHCTDDSPLFVATWYTLAILGLAIIGAVLGRFALRW